ncbi:MAG: BMP family ABC transporter substrate-binding protein [Spirochaetaceae bacterium]|nr:BMP family ABC transporter substrate-binding protein [Spirochaetaceae bacterium]
MKKRLLVTLLVLAAVTALVAAPIKVGLVTDVGGIDDKSFNQGTWEGIKLFAKENKLKEGTDVKYLQSTADADYIPNLSTFADEGLDLIVAPGFLFEQAMGQVADQYPQQKLLIIDSVVAKPNVASAVFAANEGSFLAGIAAAVTCKENNQNTVGYIGGMKFPLIENFQAGFEQGVKTILPGATILVDYSGSFTDAGLGQALAAKQYGQGAYVIFQVAGGCGNGVIKEAKERTAKGDVRWAIGVDKDQYSDGIYRGTRSAVLTSMMKRVDVASHDVAAMVRDGKFPGGQTLVFSLKNKGVGLPNANPNLSAAAVKEIKKYETLISTGKLIVNEVK